MWAGIHCIHYSVIFLMETDSRSDTAELSEYLSVRTCAEGSLADEARGNMQVSEESLVGKTVAQGNNKWKLTLSISQEDDKEG